MMKSLLVALVLSVALSSCGPSDFEKQKLAFEQQKYKDEQAARVETAQAEERDKNEQTMKWRNCRLEAEMEYDSDFKMWGEPIPGKPGQRSGPANQLQDMKNRLQRQNEECDRNFPKGISY
jgi:hypothetical protein